MLGRKRKPKHSATPDTAWESLRGPTDDGTDESADDGTDEGVGNLRQEEAAMGSTSDDDLTRPISTADLRSERQRHDEAQRAESVEAYDAPDADDAGAGEQPGRRGATTDEVPPPGVPGPDDEGHDRPASAYDDSPVRPAADHEDKAEELGDLKRPGWTYALKNAVREFLADECTDIAAALTYYAVLAIFPAGIALLALLGLVGQNNAQALEPVTQVITRLITDPQFEEGLNNAIESLSQAGGTGFALIVGVLGALFSASGYVGAFSRAMNRIYEVREGRPIWKLRPQMLLITAISIVLLALGLVILVVSGRVAEVIGNVIGVGDTGLLVWNIVKWPVLGLIVVFVVALLYWGTPNVKQPKFRWLSVGAFVAIMVWVVASALFAVYLLTFGNYAKTYGAVASVIVFLLWLWITNLALLFGAEIDAELERSRELQAGIAAEETLQLPLRDDREVRKQDKKTAKVVAKGRALREKYGR